MIEGTEDRMSGKVLGKSVLLKGLILIAGAAAVGRPLQAEAARESSASYLDSIKAHSGWEQKKGKWYYFDPSTGRMKKGWLNLGEKWYYLDQETGMMRRFWQEINGKWYYFNPVYGFMQTGWLQENGRWFYLDGETGRMKTGWVSTAKGWYYFNDKGVMQTGWQEINGKWYYMDPSSGAMRTGWLQIGGKTYYLNADGTMKTGWHEEGGKRYFLKKNGGAMAAAEVLYIDGKKEAFSGAGDWMGRKSDAFYSAYGKAIGYVNRLTTPDMTKEQKLRVCFDLFDTFEEKNPWIPHYLGEDWVEKYAIHCLDNKTSNCMGYGASFALMARAIGSDNVYACNSGGHGWCEINGLVYDPEWTRHHSGNFFGRPLVPGESQDYFHAIRREEGSWRWVRI